MTSTPLRSLPVGVLVCAMTVGNHASLQHASVAIAASQPSAQTGASLMPAERAKATFEDERVKRFLTFVNAAYSATCSVPDPAKTTATTKCTGGGDFSSCFYGIRLTCTGKDVSGVEVTAEFSPPLGTPLNLVLSVSLKR